jgi:ABC-type arginine transport system permease subunit
MFTMTDKCIVCTCVCVCVCTFCIQDTYRTSRLIQCTVNISLEILDKIDECILILVIYYKKTGLLHILLQESKLFTSSDARSRFGSKFHCLMIKCFIIAVRLFISLEIIPTLGA